MTVIYALVSIRRHSYCGHGYARAHSAYISYVEWGNSSTPQGADVCTARGVTLCAAPTRHPPSARCRAPAEEGTVTVSPLSRCVRQRLRAAHGTGGGAGMPAPAPSTGVVSSSVSESSDGGAQV